MVSEPLQDPSKSALFLPPNPSQWVGPLGLPDYEQTSTWGSVGPHPDIGMGKGAGSGELSFPSASIDFFPGWSVLKP